MIASLRASEAERRLLPGGRFDGPTGWLIAIMTFVMMLVASAGLAMGGAILALEQGARGDYTIELAGGQDRAAALVETLGGVPGVTSVSAVPEAEMRGALAKWLGPDVARDSADLPLPLLVDVTLGEGGSADALASAAARVAPGARLIRHSDRMAPLTDGLRALVGIAGLLVLLVAAGTATAVVLATHSALDTHRATLSVMHGVGASDEQIARLFQRKIALDALAGGGAGALAAALVLGLLALTVGGEVARLSGVRGFGPAILLLCLLPLGLAGLATLVARRTVLASLEERT